MDVSLALQPNEILAIVGDVINVLKPLIYTARPNSYRLMKIPMTMSCICVDFEKQIVFRARRLMRVRKPRCLRSMRWVLRFPG